ncbi:MAG: hypothetical protein ACM3ZT_05710 [Bacillota bacterium]
MYEPKHKPPLSRREFAGRMLRHLGFVLLLIGFSLAIGMAGYAHFEGMGWRDAFVNAAMLLGGMGPVKTEGLSDAGKVFAGLFALYAGLLLIAVLGILLAPAIHRLMHQFHWEGRGG